MTETVYERRIEEHISIDGGGRLGRHVKHDPKSRNYKAELADTVRDVWHVVGSKGTLPLDQDGRGSCTGEAECALLNCSPLFAQAAPQKTAGQVFTQADAFNLYDQEITDEGGNPATDDPGGTGLEICKIAQRNGLITSYTHTFSLDEALKALVLSAVMTGVNWYDSFDVPDSHGFISKTPNASIRGGHEFAVICISLARKAVGCWQSWGLFGPWANWGGRFWLPFDVWGELLDEQGDVTVPVI